MSAVDAKPFDLRLPARQIAMWLDTNLCNFHCYYCLAHSPEQKGKVRAFFTGEQLVRLFTDTGRHWWFVISGGETFLFPDFANVLCQLTAAGHWISVDTNLSQDITTVLERADPERVVMFSCAYHPESEQHPEAKQRFQARVCALADRGFRVQIPYVMHPLRFTDYEIAKREFAALGFHLTPQPCRTEWEGKVYPRDYTPEQRAVIHNDQPRPMLFDLPSYEGQICRAGHDLVRINPDGRIYRCPGHPTQLGDVAAGRLELFDAPRPCDKTVCNCNRFVRQVDMLPGQPSMIDSFQADVTVNESRIRRPHGAPAR